MQNEKLSMIPDQAAQKFIADHGLVHLGSGQNFIVYEIKSLDIAQYYFPDKESDPLLGESHLPDFMRPRLLVVQTGDGKNHRINLPWLSSVTLPPPVYWLQGDETPPQDSRNSLARLCDSNPGLSAIIAPVFKETLTARIPYINSNEPGDDRILNEVNKVLTTTAGITDLGPILIDTAQPLIQKLEPNISNPRERENSNDNLCRALKDYASLSAPLKAFVKSKAEQEARSYKDIEWGKALDPLSHIHANVLRFLCTASQHEDLRSSITDIVEPFARCLINIPPGYQPTGKDDPQHWRNLPREGETDPVLTLISNVAPYKEFTQAVTNFIPLYTENLVVLRDVDKEMRGGSAPLLQLAQTLMEHPHLLTLAPQVVEASIFSGMENWGDRSWRVSSICTQRFLDAAPQDKKLAAYDAMPKDTAYRITQGMLEDSLKDNARAESIFAKDIERLFRQTSQGNGIDKAVTEMLEKVSNQSQDNSPPKSVERVALAIFNLEWPNITRLSLKPETVANLTDLCLEQGDTSEVSGRERFEAIAYFLAPETDWLGVRNAHEHRAVVKSLTTAMREAGGPSRQNLQNAVSRRSDNPPQPV